MIRHFAICKIFYISVIFDFTLTFWGREEWEESLWNLKRKLRLTEVKCIPSPRHSYILQVSCSVKCNCLPHGLQHTSLPCLSPTPKAYSNSCSSNQWCHPIISSSIIPFSSHLQSVPASGSFSVSQFFPSGGQSIRVSASISPSNEHSGLKSFRMDWLDLLAVQGALKSLLQYHSSKASILWCSAFFIVQLSHIHTSLLEKP